MKFFLLVLLLSGFAPVVYPQSDSNAARPMPDRWRGLALNESTPADAIQILGQPAKDSTDRLYPLYLPEKWLTKKWKEKTWRQLEFKKLDGVKSATLTYQNDKLVMIELEPDKEISADALSGIYGLKFEPQVSGIWEGMKPENFERNQGKTYPKTFPSSFNMITVSEQAFVGALIGNGGIGQFTKEAYGIRDNNGIPGKVKKIQLISRKLENRDGADALQ